MLIKTAFELAAFTAADDDLGDRLLGGADDQNIFMQTIFDQL